MTITDKNKTPPRWVCQDCEEVVRGSNVSPQVANIDNVHDVFSKHRGEPLNLCPKCGGLLRLVKPAARN